jgi:hypothetical protein
MQLQLALGKCSVLHMGRRNSAQKPSYELGQVELANCDSMRDLGVIIDPELKFSLHCATVAKRASLRMNSIFRSFETRDTNFLLNMYKNYVRPTLEYASPCWAPYLSKDTKLIESVQREFTRRIPEIARKKLPYLERLNILQLERLDLRRLHSDLILTFKLMYGHVDVDPNILFTFHPQAYDNFDGLKIANTVLRLQKPNFKMLCRKHFFNVRVVSPWNSLPMEVKLSKSIREFKLRLKGSATDREGVDLSAFLRDLS